MKFVIPCLTLTLSLGSAMGDGNNDKSAGRQLYIDRIAGYMPTTDVTDQLMLDLDQYNLEEQILQRKINVAKHIYEQGGHSESYAVLTMTALNGSYSFEQGSGVWAHNEFGLQIKGTLQNDLFWDHEGNQTMSISVLYDKDQGYDVCQVGALHLFKSSLLENCFAESGTIKIAKPGQSRASGVDFPYTYNIRTDNRNGRTMQQLSLLAGSLMRDQGGAYTEDFEIFTDFYGQPDYADKWIIAAANKTSTDFKSGLGNANFAELAGREGQGEAMAKGTVFLGVYMYIIGKLEQSLMNCVIGCQEDYCKATATHNLDEAVAYYAGSLVEHTTDNTTGVFYYAFADNRAVNFKTAGHLPVKDEGTSYVNIHIFNHFKEMQTFLTKGDSESCGRAIETKKEIVRLMKIPLIQSVLAYSYIRDRDELTDEEEIEKTEAKGASYTASILPYIHRCSSKDAEVLYNQMRIGSDINRVNYGDIRRSLESNYQCLNITCEEVGGIWNKETQQYARDAGPCGVSEKKVGVIYFFSFVFAIGFVALAFLAVRYRRKRNSPKEVMFQGNIQAVSEIA